ncbi:MAG: hypothetical protein AMXMBFR57_29640 [Acidimicrobiia bacterium]
MRTILAVLFVATGAVVLAQPTRPSPAPRLPATTLDVRSPEARTTGDPGAMRVRTLPCRTMAISSSVRRRIVDIAVQEWAFFGYTVVDQSVGESDDDPPPMFMRGRGRARVTPEEGARVAASIAGFWSVTPEGGWIVDRQNAAWTGEAGLGARWNSPWSAAFISWVMCEAGLGESSAFMRAVAHHRYIDQAIRARDGRDESSAYVAYDGGEAPVLPGDMLCSGRRPAYRSLAERRRQVGQGASTHCDIVIAVDVERSRFLAIGGNVRSTVGLKIIPAELDSRTKRLRPFRSDDERIGDNPYRGVRPIFAHLKLRGTSVELDALSSSATVRALSCAGALPEQVRTLGVTVSGTC